MKKERKTTATTTTTGPFWAPFDTPIRPVKLIQMWSSQNELKTDLGPISKTVKQGDKNGW